MGRLCESRDAPEKTLKESAKRSAAAIWSETSILRRERLAPVGTQPMKIAFMVDEVAPGAIFCRNDKGRLFVQGHWYRRRLGFRQGR